MTVAQAGLLEAVQQLFQEVFDDESLLVTPETTALDVEDWDSMMHVNLMIAVEQRFGVQFATAEIAALSQQGQNVGTLMQLVADKMEQAE